MRMAWVIAAAVIGGLALGIAQADHHKKGEKPKYSISDVMKKGHKGKNSILSKIKGGSASKEEIKELAMMYKALSENKPPVGDEASWKEKTGALMAAIQAVYDGKAGAVDQLGKAANCKACHQAHRE